MGGKSGRDSPPLYSPAFPILFSGTNKKGDESGNIKRGALSLPHKSFRKRITPFSLSRLLFVFRRDMERDRNAIPRFVG